MPESINEDIIPDIKLVIYRKCTPAWKLPAHTTDAINLTYVTEGKARYTINDKQIDLVQGNLLTLPIDCVRKGYTFPDQPMHCFSVDFRLKSSRGLEAMLPFPAITTPGLREDIIRMFHELTFSWLNKVPGHVIKTRGLLLQIIHRFMELVIFKNELNTGDPRINKVIRYISAHYPERITVRKMADMVGLNPTYFGTLFKQVMKTSFNRYLIQLRINNAESILANGEYKVADIADACGFTDISHFYKQYKLIRGFPPSYSLPKKF
ncbi:MAG: AraC family transcriptional regulator [Treponema sp.]|nr:AraC family transcriptional regulator [Treponema sp.]